MSDISVTASAVVPNANAVIQRGTAAAQITAGQTVYADSTTTPPGQLRPAAQTNINTAAVVGIAVNGAYAGQPVEYATDGDVTFNSVLSQGKMYVLGSGAGGISLSADLATNRWGTGLGVAVSSTMLRLAIVVSGIQVP